MVHIEKDAMEIEGSLHELTAEAIAFVKILKIKMDRGGIIGKIAWNSFWEGLEEAVNDEELTKAVEAENGGLDF